jgi:phage terminase small subunit
MATITELDELPILTPKQSAFVNALLQGKTASDAYREAYNCEKMSQGAISVEASRLRRSPKISLWLRHLELDQARITAENHLAELARARELAIAHGQISAAVQAEHYRGKAAGLYEERLLLTGGPSDAELIRTVEALLGKETAEAISAALGDLSNGEAE